MCTPFVMTEISLTAGPDPLWPKGYVLLALVMGGALAVSCQSGTGPSPSGPPVQLTANLVDPNSVDAVSDFHSCSGHAFPDGSPNSAKNYFWPNSTNFSTTNELQELAVCDGTLGQNSDDTDANEQDRGQTLHLYCDKSSTMARYFHLVFTPSQLGQHVAAGSVLGYASMLGTGQQPSDTWQNSSNFDIAVSDGDDNHTEDYFSKLSAAAFGAWAARGLTSVAQTINAANPVCSAFLSSPGDPDIFLFTPVR